MKADAQKVVFLASLLSLGACEAQNSGQKACTPPRAYWQKPHFIGGLVPVQFQVTVDHRSTIYVGGRPASMEELARQLALVARIQDPVAEVFLDTEMGANCRTIEALRDQIDRSMDCRRSGRCAEGSRTVWMEWPIAPGTPPS